MKLTRLDGQLVWGRDWMRHRVALVVDPRFPGGTSHAVAEEIRALGGAVNLSVCALETAMFKGRQIHPCIEAALEEAGLSLIWSPSVVHADTIVIHNPSCLRFDTLLRTRLSCGQAIVVTHENFLRPNGSESFDVARCIDLIDAALVCGRRCLAPVSSYNRQTVEDWLAREQRSWDVASDDWLNILDPKLTAPNPSPRDRRGRHSRPGLEKFPPIDTLRAHFPPHADRCIMLGADPLMNGPETPPPHWDLRRFGETDVERLLAEIDFFVYFTNPNWRESFGRVVAEAIAAGKLVITDPGTAAPFASAVVSSNGDDVDEIVHGFCAEPHRYVNFVTAAQGELVRFQPVTVARRIRAQIERLEAPSHALV
ncbi:MAG: glycosyltransferase family 4 protein [Rhodobacteraceae bacterium]|nr:glycosyltransferase family 4 protein [Paracoccaceae bacterium]